MSERRGKPYIWVTWLSGLIAGDRHCEWAGWRKAHFQLVARPEARPPSMERWKAEHAVLVARRAVELREAGWTVTVEDQNKFTVRGRVATIGGVADIVARRDAVARVEDCKTGVAKDADYWQVALYMLLLPLVFKDLGAFTLYGKVVYGSGASREVAPSDVAKASGMILAWVNRIAGEAEPGRTPSAAECRYCDIAECPERIEGAIAEVDTEVF
jgi:hypothetical protein